jgi:histidinol-phosphate aminotransferase
VGISRRALVRQITVGAAAAIGLPSLARAKSIGPESSAASDGSETNGLVRLHRNENPIPSSRVLDVIRGAAASTASRYPEVYEAALRTKIASLHHVYADQVVPGCGSDDVLGLALTAFASGRTVITATPTYDRFVQRASAIAGRIVAVPIRSDYSYDLDAMLSRADAATGLVYICNPNNPTASLTRRRDIEAFIARLPQACHVVIDEAYHYYVAGSPEHASFLEAPLDDDRIIVTRSFSTAYGLAGLRVGYAVAQPAAAARMEAARVSSGISGIAALSAMAALDDTDHLAAAVKRNADAKQEFCNQANARMLRTIDSHANFVLLNTGHPSADMVEHFRKNAVLVAGPFAPFEKHIRVSLGTPAEMQEFWRVFDLLPPSHVMTM